MTFAVFIFFAVFFLVYSLSLFQMRFMVGLMPLNRNFLTTMNRLVFRARV